MNPTLFEIKRLEETRFDYRDVVSLIHLSFQERTQQGILFPCAVIQVEEYRERMNNGMVLVAIDKQTGALLGTAATRIRRNSKNQLFGHNEYLAVHPDAKRRGIASSLFRERLKMQIIMGAEYVISYTAEKADSSMSYHLKNGFRKIGLESFEGNNYYSILFRYQISKKGWINYAYSSRFLCAIRFSISSFVTRSTIKADGTPTRIGKLIKG